MQQGFLSSAQMGYGFRNRCWQKGTGRNRPEEIMELAVLLPEGIMDLAVK